ncbi:hypothetical protein UFOVP717_2 [uncultured Caudovirales phage]|uniref:Uncharacterized protein n=1 Tax=uncultured Caudovirales phage TaxID=2100421 RepID=A0A6J5NL91_9CAUD|nr:hypothetical protein UFOVP717_2 [uncultured Caudovirales phage]
MAELRASIIGEFKGKKAFKDAGNATSALDKSVKKLGKSLAAVFGAQQLLKFAKNASKAFIEDEKAANRLAIAVKNLGLEFETPRIERFISDLSKMSGVTDDQLRPAMQRLLQTTGSVTKAQELLTQATDIAAGSGVDYETVVSDLSAAYVGQTRGLRKYSLGVSVAELKTMKFAEVQDRLNKAFSGANAEYLTTYAGKLQLINTAAGEASETIGGALVESLVSVFAAGDTTKFVNQIDTLANKIADTVSAVVFGFQKLYVLTSDRAILASFNPFDDYEKNALAAIDAAEKAAKLRRNAPSMGYLGSQPMGIYETSAQIAARKKAEAAAVKRARDLAAAQNKALATQKQQNALTKATQTLDLERISIAAALRNQISETDRLSLNLQLALLDKNDAAALKLSSELDSAVKRQNALSAALLATPEAPNPYRNWVAPSMPSLAMAPSNTGGGGVIPDFNVPANAYSQVGPMGGLSAGVIAGVNPTPAINVTVELDGQTVAGAIRDSQINDSLSGSFSQTNRFAAKGSIAT